MTLLHFSASFAYLDYPIPLWVLSFICILLHVARTAVQQQYFLSHYPFPVLDRNIRHIRIGLPDLLPHRPPKSQKQTKHKLAGALAALCPDTVPRPHPTVLRPPTSCTGAPFIGAHSEWAGFCGRSLPARQAWYTPREIEWQQLNIPKMLEVEMITYTSSLWSAKSRFVVKQVGT